LTLLLMELLVDLRYVQVDSTATVEEVHRRASAVVNKVFADYVSSNISA
jgi:hypothetical protein